MSQNTLKPGASRKEILQNWAPEDQNFWQQFGKKIAKENLIVSTAALTLAFCVWYLWSTVASQLNSIGFNFTKEELFTLAALPGLVGATLRFIFTYMPAWVGGKNFTLLSTAFLLIPVIGVGFAIQDPTTSYSTFAILVALIGVAGANFASSMANIGNFFPQSEKGTALGINGGIGNLGVSIIYFVGPFAIGSATLANIFGVAPQVVKGSAVYLANAAFVWIIPILIMLALIMKYMDNLPVAKPNPAAIKSILSDKHTWIITWVYLCGFGAFSGYAASMSLLSSTEFPDVNIKYIAFLGPLLAASFRPIGGWWADKIDSGSKVTIFGLIGLVITTAGVGLGISVHNFYLFFISTLIVFLMTGFVTGGSFRMIPHLFDSAMKSNLVVGFSAAVGAYGAFISPKIFGTSYAMFGSAQPVFWFLVAYTGFTTLLTWYFYARKGVKVHA